LSLERVLKTLQSFGFAKRDAEVYVYLAKKGPQETLEIASALRIRRPHLLRILKKLQEKGIVKASPEQPVYFSALAFEKTLDLLVKANIEQAKSIKETKQELLSNWRDMTKQNST
jgi:sugar-specific transcriptional regulator TrmB